MLTRERLASLPRRRLHGGRNVTKAVVDVVEVDGRPAVVKDVAARPWPVRWLLGPWQLDREARAYGALAGVRGTPAFLGRIDRQAIALEYVPGPSLASLRPVDLPESFFDRLDAILDEIHARGVAHGDLHRHDVLLGPGGDPCLVDFSTAIVARKRAPALTRFLFRQMCRADLRSAAKLRRRLHPDARAPVPDRQGLYRLGGHLKRVIALFRRSRPRRAGRPGP